MRALESVTIADQCETEVVDLGSLSGGVIHLVVEWADASELEVSYLRVDVLGVNHVDRLEAHDRVDVGGVYHVDGLETTYL